MPLTPDHEARFRAHVQAVDASTCSVCHAPDWTADFIATVGLIARTCDHCGHVLLFSPEPIGLVPGWRERGEWNREQVLITRA